MPDTQAPVDPRHDWLAHMVNVGNAHGLFDLISAQHMALYVEEGDTLLLSFDRCDRLWDNGDVGNPLGFECVQTLNYSLLSLLCVGETWFHDPQVEAFLQRLAHEGFFSSFRQVLIVAASPDCSHAAARAARFVPGARVLLSRPVAANASSGTPFPAGPDALHGADEIAILFDPTQEELAAQVGHFKTPRTSKIALPYAGDSLDHAIASSEGVVPLTRHLAAGTLNQRSAQKTLRSVLRRDLGYLSRLSTAKP